MPAPLTYTLPREWKGKGRSLLLRLSYLKINGPERGTKGQHHLCSCSEECLRKMRWLFHVKALQKSLEQDMDNGSLWQGQL